MSFGLSGGPKFSAHNSIASSHSGANFGHAGGGLFGNLKNLFGHANDHDNHGHDTHTHAPHPASGGHCGTNGSDHSGGAAAAGNNFPTIPADTLGVTFSVDLNGDGVNDEYAVVKAPNNATAADQTLQHYYDQVAQDLSATHPGIPASQIVVKATVYSASQGESYYHFNGDETTTTEQNAANAEDHHDDDSYDHNHQHEHDTASNHHDSDTDGSDNHDSGGHESSSTGHGGAAHGGDFYTGLVSCHSGSHGGDESDHEDHGDDNDDEHNHGFHFC